MSNKIIILTGDIQTGKTTLLQQFCLQQNNIAGILTPVVNGKRMFYDISGKEFFEMEAQGDEEQLTIGKYLFSTAAFTKANHILLATGKGVEYLIIDEIGPLELRKQQGLYQSFKEILSAAFNYALIVVVRQSLVDEVIAVFDLGTPVVFNCNTEMHKGNHRDALSILRETL
ncbi:nucleoside-triphosphatase [Ferruginibacter sp. SUN106]|uniref:nucleoside-triphosphatase n=1 Tax=Ferruginibacter sp. SUN106 TaxID=2978348 RepID=UPI003D35B467